MDWLTDNFQIVVLVLLGFAGWMKSRMEPKDEGQEPPEESYDEGEVFIPEEEWQQIPADPSVPPPLVLTGPPPIPSPAAAFEAAREADAALKHQNDLAERLRQIRENKATTTGGAAATRARLAAAKAPPKAVAAVSMGLRSRLHDKGELRRAFVLKEILALPLSQR